MRPFANVLANLAKFAKKAYRDGYLETTVRGGIAFQIRALRNKFGESQEDFARRTGKKQSVISRLEDPETGKASVQSLIEIAQASDVALVVRFVSYPEFLQQTSDMSPDGLQPDTIFESLEREAVSDYGQFESLLWSRADDPQGRAEPRAQSSAATLLRPYEEVAAKANKSGEQHLKSLPYGKPN